MAPQAGWRRKVSAGPATRLAAMEKGSRRGIGSREASRHGGPGVHTGNGVPSGGNDKGRQGIQRRPSHPQPGRWVQAQGQGGGTTKEAGRVKAEPYLSLSEIDMKYINFF